MRNHLHRACARLLAQPADHLVTLLFCCALVSSIDPASCLAQVEGYYYTEVTAKGHIYKMVTGGLGSFVMIFMGLGGFATLFLTRRGSRGQNVSLPGVAMLLISASLFGLRVLIQAGVLGHEYIEW
jgi:hypothetical protein